MLNNFGLGAKLVFEQLELFLVEIYLKTKDFSETFL
jgi:hypothetical protein